LALPDGFIMVDPLAAAKTREDTRLLVAPVGRDQHGDRLPHRFFSVIAEQPLSAGIPGLDNAIEVFADDGVIRRFYDGDQSQRITLPGAPRVFRLKPGKAETKLTGKRQRDFNSRVRDTMWRIIVRHELADQFAILLDRNKRNRTDALARNRLLQLVRKIGRRDVLEIDRLRILLIPGPGRMSLDRRTVAIRKTAPGDETHEAGIIEQQNGGALAIQCAHDRIKRKFIDLRGWIDVLQHVTKFVSRRLLAPLGR